MGELLALVAVDLGDIQLILLCQVIAQDACTTALLAVDVGQARQVGKTTLIRQLGREAFPNFVELNFLENTAARKLFETASDSSDFLLRLSALAGKNLVPGKTLIFWTKCRSAKRS